MKKSAIIILLVITVAFAAFVGGFYMGRNYNHSPIQVSATMRTDPTSPTITNGSAPAITPVTTTTMGLININTATLQQLDMLPGIGTVRAQAIIDYREANGPFQTVEDLLNVDGIGEKTLAKFIDYITVGG